MTTGLAADLAWMATALEWSRHCPPTVAGYNVGCVIVRHGLAVSHGFSRENHTVLHAEESALAKAAGQDLTEACVYSTLEPCSIRMSALLSCTQLILASGIRRVVFALHEPLLLADCEGAELLARAGVEVVELSELAGEVTRINAHLIGAA